MSQNSTPNHRPPPGGRSLLSGLLLGGLLTVFVAMFAYVAYLFLSWGQAAAEQAPELPPLALPKIVRPASESNAQQASAQIPFFRQPGRAAQQEEVAPSVQRTTILLLGVDARPGQKIARTDSIILLTFNPENNSAGMLSIPRDLKVRPSSLNRDMKITSVYPAGEAVGYPGGGAALLEQTITELLGYPIDHYVIVNFEGFKQIVDQIDGVDITVPYEIYDDRYPDDNYGYLPPIHFLPGKQHMDGDAALKYARTRHADNDYARAGRQQQVIMAIKDKVTSQGQMAALLPRIPGLAVAMANSVQTDVPIDEALTLARTLDKMDLNNIARVVINPKMGTVVQNDAVLGYTLIPDVPKVRAAADAIFADTVAGPSPEEVQRQTIQAEAARVVLLNGTKEKGLASKMQSKLVTQGFNVTTVGNADRADYDQSTLVIYGEPKQATIDALMTWFGISEDRVTTEPGAEDKDIKVIVGNDQSQPTAAANAGANATANVALKK